MRFQSAAPNENFFYRFVSTEGLWEIGFYQVLFGVRVRLGRVGAGFVALDYCAADNPDFAANLLLVIIKILDRYPETVSEGQLSRDFPRWRIKPINLDPCWVRLQEMAVENE